ncbi:hypothetical protein C8R32_10873 [Nitrosospira sp. Nsp5]|uniref:Uncharacterized protein n=1 Tax=Nitrosospira multiformis TaxID=1231 RepID=A0ABY0T6K0_9PROT|nr:MULTISPECIES: hypothetical protein [Nitrosospira]PTR07117.1 hypothetical protein C8R32_10873 [Nitrosospira sp. Nsp5]SDQ33863.1 hypothetical protein SAMN05216402_0450 [Nitrosospira multiformis]
MDSWDFLRLRAATLHDLHQFVPENYYGSLPSYEVESWKLDYELGKKLLFSSSHLGITARQRCAGDLLMRLGLCGAVAASLELFEDEDTRNDAKQKLALMEAELPEFVRLYAEYLSKDEAKPLLAILAKKSETKAIGAWPWGGYETALLRKLALAVESLWNLYDPSDPSTAPTNEQVEDFLKKRGVPDRTAEIMATILRADGLPRGRRK